MADPLGQLVVAQEQMNLAGKLAFEGGQEIDGLGDIAVGGRGSDAESRRERA